MRQALQIMLNQAYQRIPALKEILAPLQSKSIMITITKPPKTLSLSVYPEAIELSREVLERADLDITGEFSEMVRLIQDVLAQKTIPALSAYGLKIYGDVQLLQALQKNYKTVDWNMAEVMAPYTGRFIAEHSARFLERLGNKLSMHYSDLRVATQEYLLYETKMMPLQSEIDIFSKDTVELQNEIDRLRQRLNKLERN